MEILKCLEANDIESAAIQSLQGAEETVLGGKFQAIQAFLKKQHKKNSSETSLPP